MTLFKLLADRDVASLAGSNIRFDGGHQQVFMLPKLVDHFIHDLQHAVITLRDDPRTLDDNHLAGTIDLGQFISERI